MSLKDRLKQQLVRVRQLTERLLADFKKPDDWVHQVHPNCNHALWFAGHMTTTDNFLLSLVAPERFEKMDGFAAKFGMGSHPTGAPGDYPPPAEVLAKMRSRREQLLEVLDGLSEEDLSRKTPAGAPDFLPDFASVFEMAIWHEGLHAGQLSVVRRVLGYPPVMGG